MIVAIAAVAGVMDVTTPIGSATLAEGLQVGSADPIEWELGSDIKVKLTWRSHSPEDSDAFAVNKSLPLRQVGGGVTVSNFCKVKMKLHVDGGSAILGSGRAEAWLGRSWSQSFIIAVCERGASGKINF